MPLTARSPGAQPCSSPLEYTECNPGFYSPARRLQRSCQRLPSRTAACGGRVAGRNLGERAAAALGASVLPSSTERGSCFTGDEVVEIPSGRGAAATVEETAFAEQESRIARR